MILIRNLNKKGCQQTLGGLAEDRKIIERGIGQAQAREEAERIEITAMSRTLGVIDTQIAEVRARLDEIEATEAAS